MVMMMMAVILDVLSNFLGRLQNVVVVVVAPYIGAGMALTSSSFSLITSLPPSLSLTHLLHRSTSGNGKPNSFRDPDFQSKGTHFP